MTKAQTFTAKISDIKKCDNMWELRLSYKNQPDWQWVAAKLFQDSKIWIEGEDLDLTDPWADPSKIKTEKHEVLRIGYTVTIRPEKKPVKGPAKNKKTGKNWIGSKTKKEVIKMTFNLNEESEIEIFKRA